MAMGSSEISSSKTELDKYLGEECKPKDQQFDILLWWKLNQCRYPILAKMARDVLAILVLRLPRSQLLAPVDGCLIVSAHP
ncbi:hypothetical protein L1987_47706 [Smallanthus sonchifolius]|uniref:Uncharacterized protein n=1 Tax=Smallanthus sonchifolius TaxID=185202 RepID=A0ACB9G4B5_9ASTR|nr:hypothetical protein L1987_47706 [Smallanthus sonchifolius]